MIIQNLTWVRIIIAYEFQPKNYEELVALKNMGSKTIRALALISELVYGTKNSWEDPAKFSYTHGGKDGVPYEVNRKGMDNNTTFLKEALEQGRLGQKEKLNAIKRYFYELLNASIISPFCVFWKKASRQLTFFSMVV